MQNFPHRYQVKATADAVGDVSVASARLPVLKTGPPLEFGGTGDRWSPETLLMAAVADCLVLTFRAIARASKLEWLSLRCDVEGVLDLVDRVPQFVTIAIRVALTIPADGNEDRAERLIKKAEASCLITNSLKAPVDLKTTIDVAD